MTSASMLEGVSAQERRFAVNFSALFLSQAASKAIGLALTVVIARHLGARAFGMYAFAFAFVGLFAIISDAGLERLLVREMSRDLSATGRLLINGLLLDALLCLIAFGGACSIIRFFHQSDGTYALVALVAIYLVVSSWNSMLAAVLRAHQRMEIESAIILAERVATLAGVVIAVRWNATAHQIVVVAIATVAAKAVLLLAAGRRLTGWQLERPRAESVGRLTRDLLPFLASGAFTILYFRVDTVLLRIMRGEESVGLYAAAYRFLEGLMFFASLAPVVVFPLLSSAWARNDRAAFQEWSHRLLRWAVTFILLVAAPIAGSAPEIMRQLYDVEFARAAGALNVLAWTLVPVALHHSMARRLEAQDHAVWTAYSTAALVVINVFLNLWLIPLYDFYGSATATLLTELCAVLILWGVSIRLAPASLLLDLRLLRMALSGAGSYFLARWLAPHSLVGALSGSVAGYFFLSFLLQTLPREEWAMIRSLASRRAGA